MVENGSRLEGALDQGDTISGDRCSPIREVKIELKEGTPSTLFVFALKIEPWPPIRPDASVFRLHCLWQAITSACARNGVALSRVNPAYTSIIGRVKFALRYGLSVHEAASVTIARRAMGNSERLPRSSTGTVKVPTDGCDHVTLEVERRTRRIRRRLQRWGRRGEGRDPKGESRRRGAGKCHEPALEPWRAERNRSMVLWERQDVPARSRFSHAARGRHRAGN